MGWFWRSSNICGQTLEFSLTGRWVWQNTHRQFITRGRPKIWAFLSNIDKEMWARDRGGSPRYLDSPFRGCFVRPPPRNCFINGRRRRRGKMHDARLEVNSVACLRGEDNLATTNLFITTIYSSLVDAN